MKKFDEAIAAAVAGGGRVLRGGKRLTLSNLNVRFVSVLRFVFVGLLVCWVVGLFFFLLFA